MLRPGRKSLISEPPGGGRDAFAAGRELSSARMCIIDNFRPFAKLKCQIYEENNPASTADKLENIYLILDLGCPSFGGMVRLFAGKIQKY